MPYRGAPTTLGGLGQYAPDKLAYDYQGAKAIFSRVETVLHEMFGHHLIVEDKGNEYALEIELPPRWDHA